ncbi:FAR1-related sequence 5-like protein [Tanacetum coccineum]
MFPPAHPNTSISARPAVHVGDDQKPDKLGANVVGINCLNGLWNNGRRTIISVPLLVLTMEALLWSCQKFRTQCSQQSYKVSDSFPFKWINKKWRECFHVTSMATAGTRWGIVMSRNAGFSDQLKAPKEVVVTDCVDREGTQGSGSGGWDGGGVGKIFEKYHVGRGFMSTVNEAAMSFILNFHQTPKYGIPLTTKAAAMSLPLLCVDERRRNLGKECHGVIMHFKERAEVDKDFYFTMDLSTDGTLRNVFWADGGALLENETAITFTWLFKQFLKCMHDCPPISIITDQDLAMGIAFGKVFPQTRHRHCAWHIQKHVLEHLQPLRSQYDDFQDTYTKWVKSPNIEDYEAKCEELKEKYHIDDDCWLGNIYKLRHHWIKAYLKDTFFAGMTTS